MKLGRILTILLLLFAPLLADAATSAPGSLPAITVTTEPGGEIGRASCRERVCNDV